MNQYKIIVFLLVLWSLPIFGQDEVEDEPDQEIQTEVIEVVKLYEPILAKAQKINISPDLVKIETEPPTFNKPDDYDVPNRFLTLSFEPPTLRPLAIKRQRKADLSKFWLKAGFGNYLSPYLDLAVSSTRPNNNIIGFNVKHHSAFPNNLEYQHFMTNLGRIFGKFYVNNGYIKVNLDYEHDRYHRYGLGLTDSLDLPSVLDSRVTYQAIPFSFEFGNTKTNRAQIDHKTKIDYHYFWSNEEIKEHNVSLTTGLYKNWDNGYSLGLDLYTDFTNLSDSINYGADATELLALNASPNLSVRKPFGEVRVGVNLLVDEDDFQASPLIYAAINVLEKYLTVYGGWDRKILKNNFRSLTKANPYLGTLQPTLNNSIKESRYIGFKGNLGANLMFDIKGGQFWTTKQVLFVNQPITSMNMLATYDSLTTAVGGNLTLAYQIGKKGTAQLKTSYYNYTTTDTLNNAYAWNLPNLQVNFAIDYNITERFHIGADIILLNGIIAKNPVDFGSKIDLTNITDINLSADYRVLKNLYIYCEVNNIANQKYQRFYLYPTYGINFHGGIILRF